MPKSIFIHLPIIVILFLGCKREHQGKSDKTSKISTSSNKILEEIQLPPGFKIEVFANNLTEPRSLSIGDNGTVFFSNRTKGNVFALKDFNNDHKPDTLYTIATGLTSPNGIVYWEDDLYIAETSKISVIHKINEKLGHTAELFPLFNGMPGDYMHGWRYIGFGPDAKLYVSVGASCDSCEEPEEYANIIRLNADGTNKEIVAAGIRNSVGFDWHPVSGKLWFSENGCDELGDSIPPDEINIISEKNGHYGFPYKYGSNIYSKDLEAPEIKFTDPKFELPSHVAPLGIHFYRGNMFPSNYRNQLFICEHGSRKLEKKRGYRITLLEIDSAYQVSKYSVFASGWLNEENQRIHGRPVDMKELPDGSLLISDDFANVIYRISYSE